MYHCHSSKGCLMKWEEEYFYECEAWEKPTMRTNLECLVKANSCDQQTIGWWASEIWKESFTNETWRDIRLTWLPTVLRKGRREMPKHWMEEKVYSLEDFSVNCACPNFSVRWHRNLNTRCLNYVKVKELVVKVLEKNQNKGVSLSKIDIKPQIKSHHGLLCLDGLDLQTFILFWGSMVVLPLVCIPTQGQLPWWPSLAVAPRLPWLGRRAGVITTLLLGDMCLWPVHRLHVLT